MFNSHIDCYSGDFDKVNSEQHDGSRKIYMMAEVR